MLKKNKERKGECVEPNLLGIIAMGLLDMEKTGRKSVKIRFKIGGRPKIVRQNTLNKS